MIFHLLGIPFSSMKFALIIHRFWKGCWYHFWCFFDTFTVRACNLPNHQKHMCLQWISMLLQFRETWFVMIFLIFFVTSFGIIFLWVLGSILAPFWLPFGIKFHVFGWSFWGWIFVSICYWFLIKEFSKSKRTVSSASLPFRILFPHTCTFYWRKTYKCQKPLFPICFSTN